LSPAQPQPAAVSVWRFVSRVPSGVLRRRLSCHRIGCATDNRFAQRLPIRGTRQPRSCLHREGDLLGQVSGQSVPVCGAFVEYSSYDPFSPKTSGLWTHITIGPKKWGQAKARIIFQRATPRSLSCTPRGVAVSWVLIGSTFVTDMKIFQVASSSWEAVCHL